MPRFYADLPLSWCYFFVWNAGDRLLISYRSHLIARSRQMQRKQWKKPELRSQRGQFGHYLNWLGLGTPRGRAFYYPLAGFDFKRHCITACRAVICQLPELLMKKTLLSKPRERLLLTSRMATASMRGEKAFKRSQTRTVERSLLHDVAVNTKWNLNFSFTFSEFNYIVQLHRHAWT